MTPPNDTQQGPGEQQRGEPRKGMISGQTFRNKEVMFSAIGGQAVFKGDITTPALPTPETVVVATK